MAVWSETFEVRTKGKGTYEITDDVAKIVRQSKIANGRRDLEEYFDRLVPENASYFARDSEGPDDMPSQIRVSRSDYQSNEGVRRGYSPRTVTMTRRR